MNLRKISEVGEFGLIDIISNKVKNTSAAVLTGIGDDAAVRIWNADKVLLASTDVLVENIHFDLTYCPITHIGYKAIATNVSDIAAMNGKPLQVTVGLAISSKYTIEAIEQLYDGMQKACLSYNIDLVGGDITSSEKGLIISVHIIGEADQSDVVRRGGAKIHDIICVTGDLGGAYLGLLCLQREKAEFSANPEMVPKLEGKDYLIGKQLKPEARMDVIYDLKERGIVPTSMIDISDGLASELNHICQKSKVGAKIFQDKLPVDAQAFETADEFNLSISTCALHGGEEYELLFTVDPKDFEKIRNHPDITPLGFIWESENGIVMQTTSDEIVDIKPKGFTHF